MICIGIKETVTLGQASSTWAFQAAAYVIQRPIHSVYPFVNGQSCVPAKLLNVTFSPSGRRRAIHPLVPIMWTSCSTSRLEVQPWIPNHFVPIIPRKRMEPVNVIFNIPDVNAASFVRLGDVTTPFPIAESMRVNAGQSFLAPLSSVHTPASDTAPPSTNSSSIETPSLSLGDFEEPQ